jgi:hypothetical protein
MEDTTIRVTRPRRSRAVLPAWLVEALVADRQRPSQPAPEPTGPPIAGDLWWARGDKGARRLVAIIEAVPEAPEGPSFQVVLVSPEIELAYDQTLEFRAEETGLPFAILVETGLLGPVLAPVLETRAGQLPIDLAVLADAAQWGEFDPALDGRRGLPIRGPHDARLAPLEAELEDLWALIGSWQAAFWVREADYEATALERAITTGDSVTATPGRAERSSRRPS